MNRKRTNQIICSLESCINMESVNIPEYFKELQDLGKKIVRNDNFRQILEFCTCLGNKERLKIVEILKEQDRCVCELEAILDKSQPSISHHLRVLESANLIRSFKKDKFTHYELNSEQFEKSIENMVYNYGRYKHL